MGTAGSCSCVGIHQVPVPCSAGTPPRATVSATVPGPYLLESHTRNPSSSLAWGMPRVLISFSSIAFLLKGGSLLLSPVPHVHFFAGPCQGQSHCVRWGIKAFPNSKSQGLHPFRVFSGWIALHLIKQPLQQHLSADKGVPNSQWCPGLEFSVCSQPILSLSDVTAKPAESYSRHAHVLR